MRSIRKFNLLDFNLFYISKEIMPWRGMVFLRQMLQKKKFCKLINDNPDLSKSLGIKF